MPKLRVMSEYLNRGREVHYKPGAIVEVTEDERRFYLADSPGSFEDVIEDTEPTAKELPEPPVDKAVKRAPRTKRVRGRSEPDEET